MKEIYPEWGSILETNYDDIMSMEDTLLSDIVINRNLLVIKGLSKDLTDEEFFGLGKKFGKVWTKEEYRKPYVGRGSDKTLNSQDTETPVSYFQSHNNAFGAKYMAYHADMVHVNELSYPGRLLYMTQNTKDRSGTTTWLNMELGWQLMTDEEKGLFDGVEIVNHDMYIAHSRMEKFPLLKTNPKTGKVSPRLNCWYTGRKPNGRESLGWVHHVVLNGVDCSIEETGKIITSLYNIMESKQNTRYSHRWEEGDIVVYDNWFNVHQRDAVNDANMSSNEVRLLRRITFNFQ